MGYGDAPGIRYLSDRTDWTTPKEADSGPVTGKSWGYSHFQS